MRPQENAFTFPFFAVHSLSTGCRPQLSADPSLLTWLCTSLSVGVWWSFLALFHFLFHLKLVCSRSATSYLATAVLSARGRASTCSGPCCESSSGSSVLYLCTCGVTTVFLRNLDQLLKLSDIVLTRSLQGVRIPPGTFLLLELEMQIRLLLLTEITRSSCN